MNAITWILHFLSEGRSSLYLGKETGTKLSKRAATRNSVRPLLIYLKSLWTENMKKLMTGTIKIQRIYNQEGKIGINPSRASRNKTA